MSDNKNHWAKYAEKLYKNGWPLVQIGYKSKKPVGNKWQSRKFTLAQVREIAESGKPYGIGIQCGNLIGIDNDYELGGPVTEEFIESIQELTDHFFPDAMLRRGRPTRLPLRLVRIGDDDIVKSRDVGKLQIIGKGRQFVAYGIHPDTGRGYAWLKAGSGSPASVPLSDVPSYAPKTLQKFINSVLLLEETFGLAPDKGREALRQIKEGKFKPLEQRGDQRLVERACEYIVEDPKWGWDDWNNNVMMALYGASDGADWGLELAHKVSQTHDEYDADYTDQRWEEISKSPPDYIGWPRLNWLARQNGMPFLGPVDWDNYIYFRDRTELYETTSSSWVIRQSFEDEFGTQREKSHRSAVQTFVNARPEQVYHTVGWNPNMPSGATNKGNLKIWNLWVEPDWYGKKGDVEPWLKLMKRVYEDEMNIVIKRMAFDMQYLHHRPQWHVLVIGDQGIGKNTSIYPLMEWAKRYNLYSMVGIEDIKGAFNAFFNKKKLLVLNELKSVDSNRFNKMKDWLAGTENQIKINDKYAREYYVSNIGSWWFNTNATDPVSLSRNERRLLVCKSHAKTPITSEEKRAAYLENKWIKKNWPAVIWYLKNEVEVDENYGSVLPRRTRAHLDLAEMTASMHEEVAEVIPQMLNGTKLFTVDHISEKLMELGSSLDLRHLNNKTVVKALHKLNAIKCNAGKQIKFPGSVRRYVWTFDTSLASEGNDTIRRLWEFMGPKDD